MNNLRMTHAEAELLLPWYANHTLTSVERDAVGDHLDRCEECQQALTLLTRMKAAVNDSDTVPLVPDPQPDRLFARLDRGTSTSGSSRKWWAWSMAAGFALVVMSAALVYTGRSPDPTQPAYRTATSASANEQISYVVELRFADSVSEQEYQVVLNELGATPISVVDSGTLRVVVAVPTTSMREAERWREELKARPEIADAQIVAVQLPVLEDE